MKRLFIILLTGYLLSGCDPNKIQMEEPIIRVSSEQLSSRPFLANDVTKIIMEVELQESLARSEELTITSTHGSLFYLNTSDFSSENQELVLDPIEKITKFILRTGTVSGEAYLSATVDKIVGFDTINFVNAYSETISMATPKNNLSLSSGETIELTIKLGRLEGLVSSGQLISLSASDPFLVDIPTNILSDDQGEATITVRPLSSGDVIIEGSVTSNSSGSSISATTMLSINN